MPDLVRQLRQFNFVPVIVIDDPDNAIPLAAALIEGGLPCADASSTVLPIRRT
jgi:2-dehydro-3-deoxyphosphogluconate aldolase / (4S)-4-hydroxy-2-oxoglutarate aldolase